MTTIDLQLRTTTNFHSTPTVNNEGKMGNTKFIRTTQARVAIVEENNAGDKRLMQVPCIHSNQLRGRIRRNIAERMLTSMRERDLKIGVDLIHLLTALATSASPSAGLTVANAIKHLPEDPAEYYSKDTYKTPQAGEHSANQWRLEHLNLQTSDAFVALFGGGPNLWQSRLVVNDMLANVTALAGCDFSPNQRLASIFDPIDIPPFDLTQVLGSKRSDDLFNGSAKFTDDRDEVEAWIKIDIGSDSRKKKNDSEGEEAKSNIKNLMAKETVIPGTPFVGSLVVKHEDVSNDMHDVMVGLVAIALEDIDELDQTLGSNARSGWGKFNVSLTDAYSKQKQAALNYIDTCEPGVIMEAFGVAFR
jgi:hypothetical protein